MATSCWCVVCALRWRGYDDSWGQAPAASSPVRGAGASYVPVWATREDFATIQVSSCMLKHHLPDVVLAALRGVAVTAGAAAAAAAAARSDA